MRQLAAFIITCRFVISLEGSFCYYSRAAVAVAGICCLGALAMVFASYLRRLGFREC